jgi:hypothetical protein
MDGGSMQPGDVSSNVVAKSYAVLAKTFTQQEYACRENPQSIEGTEGERSWGDHPLGSKRRPIAAGRASLWHHRSAYVNQDTDVRS